MTQAKRETRAVAEVVAETDAVRVTRWRFPEAGAATGAHTHEFDYVVTPVTGGTLSVHEADGSVRELVQEAGVSYLGVAGASHDVVSSHSRPVVFVEVELKRGA
jgi:quercetin dioxygenase-like cupin family protein